MNDRACPRDGVRPYLESLEARLLLDGTAAQHAMELFSVSPALFVENQGQWADPSVRYVHHGNGRRGLDALSRVRSNFKNILAFSHRAV